MIDEEELKLKKEKIKNKSFLKNKKNVFISVKNKINIDKLLEIIYKSLPRLVKFKLKLPINSETQSMISWIYEIANVLDISYDEYVNMSIECDIIIRDKIISKSKKVF
jgi:50S ribosomal subunit-associated GTPase HflX